MFETLKNAFKVKEIRKKIFITLLILLVYRIGCYIPVPGISASTFSDYIADGSNNFLTLMSAVTGGALANGTLFALGIGPYINASIIVQLLCVGIPALERLSKQGEEGKKKIAQITRWLTLLLAVIQSIGIIVNFANQADAIRTSVFFDQAWLAYIFMVIVYSAGAMLTMWLGERITEYGVGNGISLIIFIGILSTAGNVLIVAPIMNAVENSASFDAVQTIISTVVFCVIAVVLFALIVTVDLAERRIPVQYAKQVAQEKQIPHQVKEGAYGGTEARAFQTAGSLSGSLWYPGWLDYMEQHPPRPGEKIYLSLGDREEFGGPPLLRTVGDCTRRAHAFYKEKGLDTVLEWNKGGHGKGVDGRWKKALAWMCRAVDEKEGGRKTR